MSLRIGLLIVATGRYVEFLQPLLISARQHFFAEHNVTKFVFTDAVETPKDTVRLHVQHEPWPFPTLKRYHYFTEHECKLASMDYLYYVDVDMRFVDKCGEETLPDIVQRLTGVSHPGYYSPARPSHGLREFGRTGHWRRHRNMGALPFERDPRSLACISDYSYGDYYAAGFNGGYAESFLSMARTIRDAIDHDLESDLVATWHDESHLNRYFYVQRPKMLSPAYCYPESGYPHLQHLRPVIIALDKNHEALRALPSCPAAVPHNG